MALTRITKGVIKPNENYDTHNINSTGIVTAIGLDINGNGDISGNLSVGGVLTYEDVTSIDSVGIITAQSDIHVGGGVSAVGVGTFSGLDISGDLDVDGHTNLDNVSVAGVTTFYGNPTIYNADPQLTFQDSNHSPFYYYLKGRSGSFVIEDSVNGDRVSFNSTGSVSFSGSVVVVPSLQVSSNAGVVGNINLGSSIIHTNDTDTKIHFPANDTIRFETAGSQRININSSGKVSITNDLDVDGHTNLDNVSIAGVTTFSGNVNSSGNITISNTTPTLTFTDTDANPDFQIKANTGHFYFVDATNNQTRFYVSPDGTTNFEGNLNANRDFSVERHTNLDNVSVAGVSTFSGVVRVPNGSAGAPAIHFGDSDTGVYGDASNGVRLTAGGSDTIVATTNGVTFPPKATALTSFTLGSQSALSKPLYFADAASVESASILLDNSSQELRIKNGRFSGTITFTTYNTERLRIEADGGVNIGAGSGNQSTLAPLLQLHKASSAATAYLHITNTDSGITNNDGLVIGFNGSNDALFFNKESTPIRLATAGTERLRITSTGVLNVPAGIGPQLRFENQHSVTTDAVISTFDDASGTLLCLGSNFYINSSGAESRYNTSEESTGIILNRQGYINLNTGSTGTNALNRIQITETGKVQIGLPGNTVSLPGGTEVVNIRAMAEGNLHVRAIGSLMSAPSGSGVGLDVLNNAGNTVKDLCIRGAVVAFRSAAAETLRITSDGYVHLGNTGHGTNSVGGQAITGQDFNPRFKIYNTTASSWLMHLRNDVSTNPNGIFMRAGNSSTNYSLYITGGDENKPHIIARGDQKVGIASATPYTTLDVGGSINAGTANQPYQRMFSAGGHQRATKHYFRCVRGSTTIFDIVTVDLNQNFHQAICKVFYGTRLQGISDSTTQVNEIIFGINRFIGNTPTRNRQVIYQDGNTANHADIDVVITSSTQYRVRLTFSGSTSGSSFAGGYVELIGVGSGGDGAFYSLAHSSGINY